MRVEVEETLVLALHPAQKRDQQRVLEHIGKIAGVVLVAVVHAPTETFTTDLSTRPDASAATEGRCASSGKKTATSPGSTRRREPLVKSSQKSPSRSAEKPSFSKRFRAGVSSINSALATIACR
jgi:hypothetical protein